jgi:hypothetical protein
MIVANAARIGRKRGRLSTFYKLWFSLFCGFKFELPFFSPAGSYPSITIGTYSYF